MESNTLADEDVRCSYHPDTVTRLRCSRCGKPICPRCGVRTPVGLRCPDCAGVRGLPTYRTGTDALLIAMMVTKPEGLWPSPVRRRELRAAEEETAPQIEQVG